MESNRFVHLRCLSCHQTFPLETHSTCSRCGGVLSGEYDLKKTLFGSSRNPHGIWRYAEFFPPVNSKNIVSLGEGSTPLVEARRFSESFAKGSKIFCKLESTNPTGSFKDRIASLGLTLARGQEKKGVFTASSGNAAAAISAYSAHAGIGCLILIRDDATVTKLSQIAMYGPSILRVRNLYNTLEDLARALDYAQRSLPEWMNHFIWATYNPLFIDALKTIAYEIAFERRLMPDYVFVPVAGGDLLYGIFKGFRELREMGIIERMPKLVAVQGKGAAPLVQSIERGYNHTMPIEPPARTIAGALRVTFGADHALTAVKESQGFGVAVSDSQILQGQRRIAKLEGIFCETSAATTIAAITMAVQERKIDSNETSVAILTGIGFKDYAAQVARQKLPPLVRSVESIPKALNHFKLMSSVL